MRSRTRRSEPRWSNSPTGSPSRLGGCCLKPARTRCIWSVIAWAGRHRASHRKRSPHWTGRHGRHPCGALRGFAVGGAAAIRDDRAGAAGRLSTIAPTRLRAGTRRRAVAGIHGHGRHDRARCPVGAHPPRSGDRKGRRRRPQRDAPEPASCRPHSRRVARLRVGRGRRSERTAWAVGRLWSR